MGEVSPVALKRKNLDGIRKVLRIVLPVPGLASIYKSVRYDYPGFFFPGILDFIRGSVLILFGAALIYYNIFKEPLYKFVGIFMGIPMLGLALWWGYNDWNDFVGIDRGDHNIIIRNHLSDAFAIFSSRRDRLDPVTAIYIPENQECHLHFVHPPGINVFVMCGTGWDKERMRFNNPFPGSPYFLLGDNNISRTWIRTGPGLPMSHFNYSVTITAGSNIGLTESDFSVLSDYAIADFDTDFAGLLKFLGLSRPESAPGLSRKELVKEVFQLIKRPEEELLWDSQYDQLTGVKNIPDGYKSSVDLSSLKEKWPEYTRLLLGTTSRIIIIWKDTPFVYSIDYERIHDVTYVSPLAFWEGNKIKIKCYNMQNVLLIETPDAETLVNQILPECPRYHLQVRPDLTG